MRNKTKAAVTINRLGEKQGEGGGEGGGFLGITWFSGENGEERGRDFPPAPSFRRQIMSSLWSWRFKIFFYFPVDDYVDSTWTNYD